MKMNTQFISFRILAIFGFVLLFTACKKETNTGGKTITYKLYSPVYKSKTDVLATLNGNASQTIGHAGKIYIKDNFIYLNDINKGIHVIDNSNPAHPVQTAFLSIPGNLDIAIKGNILYADMYNDLLALDITDIHHAVITSTLSDFFTGRNYVNGYSPIIDNQVVVEWNEHDTTVLETDNPMNCYFCFDLNNGGPVMMSATASANATGTAGSMAAMVLMNDHLYAITEMHSLGIVDVTNPATPTLDSNFFAGYDLQTVFPFKGKLFLGSAVGMFMYDVTDPKHPSAAGQFSHGQACDPVITDGNYAYVTLHAGDGCGGDANELHVIDVRDLANSTLLKTYPLTKPTGLSKDGDLLFICDGNAVKLYNAATPASLLLLQQINSNNPYDVIAGNHNAIVACNDGLYQYDYSNLNNVHLLSFLPAKK